MKAAPPFSFDFRGRVINSFKSVCHIIQQGRAGAKRRNARRRKKNQKFPRKFRGKRGKGLTICCFAVIIEMRIGKKRPRKIKIFYKEATTVDDRSRGDDKPGLTVFSADAPFVCYLL